MKKNLPYKLFALLFTFSFLSASSQSDRNGYAVTDMMKNGTNWKFLRSINLRTGAYSNILANLFESNDTSAIAKAGVAAIAHDRDNRRVYFTAMKSDRLSYVDLRNNRVYVAKNNFTGLMPKAGDQSNIITRMVIGDDEKGYALTNDGMHLIRFTTNRNTYVQHLGALVDDPSNGENSVHNTCSSYGGDIIADDDNNLYLFTIRNTVYKINIRTRVARFIGTICGLPTTFYTTGAAVDPTGRKVILVSSVDASDVYSLNMQNLSASALGANNAYHAADLGSAGILKIKRRYYPEDDRLITVSSSDNEKIQLYPNPVTSNEFKVQFTDTESGNYRVDLLDIRGQLIVSKMVAVNVKMNTVTVSVPLNTAKGFYFVRITDKDSKMVFSDKLILQ